ncbi:oligoribonuclease [Vibrio europaeus]|uniref:oligoribonuclease n=1 Tax=Vibrio europaeus TaxID=300876 RepID=UPI00233EDF37|nr:oligoribonuclease [Vibrio europaeus]MDC5753542.1 oligoribonuclease [Vibrio europaeus]MDC5816545.1 oligoribonuclease [Vibrio europaeus]
MEIKEYDFSKHYPVNNPLEEAALVWLDMETGGLNGRLENGKLGCEFYPIFEIAVKVTNGELVELCEPLRLVIYQSDDMIARSSSWALEKHTESGLLKEVRENGIELDTAERLLLEYLAYNGIGAYDRKAGTGGILAGNGIFYDRSFILAQMPRTNAYLYYRQFDVSAINLGARLWNHDLYEETRLAKEYKHEAMADINESLDEARVYKKRLED